ncbi:hypothetical protein BDF21DRAFT_411456 [Thamnidium elegans]|nr:hypothetical protein BDF21DRAFT_411456 [Thamnidium elegans]
MKHQLEGSSANKAPTTNVIVDCDNVGSTVKTKAVNLRGKYHPLRINDKVIIPLGLDSIIGLAFAYPHSQSTLFTSQQWSELRNRCKPKEYDNNEYM